MSWERLQALAAAHRRRDAVRTLRLAQTIIAGQADANAWRKKQQELIEEIKGNE